MTQITKAHPVHTRSSQRPRPISGQPLSTSFATLRAEVYRLSVVGQVEYTSPAGYRLSEADRSFVATNLNEEDGVREEKIAELRRWLFSAGGTCTCVVYETDEFFIVRFLRSCKFRVKDAKRKIKNYFDQRASLPGWYNNRNPFLPVAQEFLKIGMLLPLRKVDSQGRTVIIVRPCFYDPSKLQMADSLKVMFMILDTSMRENVISTLYGVSAIIDLEGTSMGHVLQLPPHVLKQLVHAWQDCYPLRIKSFHFVNPPPFLNVVMNVIKSFMVKKLRDRIHVHSKNESLLEFVNADIIPPRYGGSGETIDCLKEYWKSEVEKNADWLSSEEKNDAIWSERSKSECKSCEKA